ncbi:PIN domain-containing protein [Massilia pseudoviolaceinigra]|uniref:PIN domain-containing protein n=1 Tax=Massilia pseudoviolaceinigra TaxID=3057165 RepID=UPI0027966119|nr:PIN domain-containing protein [Massilia sp. CCM 9206]MDQ1921955.1 PIN domain-containing protein [Massilia sp. CCM 9206]
MVKALFDTNILIDYLNGIPEAELACDHYVDKAISVVTWMEIMEGVDEDEDERLLVEAFLGQFELVPIDHRVALEASRVREAHAMRLPDAVIQATANLSGRVLITRDTRDFVPGDTVLVPYILAPGDDA